MNVCKVLKKHMVKRNVKKTEPVELDLETIERINSRIEQAALDYDIPYPTGMELKQWQVKLMQN